MRGDPAAPARASSGGSSGPSARTRSTIGLAPRRGQLGRLGDDDPERLPPPELDEHRLAGLEIGERVRHEVGVRPVPAASGRVDRDLDGAPAAGRRPRVRTSDASAGTASGSRVKATAE